MIKSSKDNNELGRKMENNANKFLREATNAFERLDTERTNMDGKYMSSLIKIGLFLYVNCV